MANTAAHFKFANDLGNTLVQIIAGTSNTPYTLNGGPKENLKLWLDADPSTIASFVRFLYKGQVPVSDEDESTSEEPSFVRSRVTNSLIPIPAPSQADIDLLGELILTRSGVKKLEPFFKENLKEDEEKILKHRRLDKLRRNRKFISVKGPNSIIQPDPEPIEANDTINHHQITLIHLCLLAEKIYWPNLFRASLISFLTDESLILTWSKLRGMVLDGFSIVDEKVDMDMSLHVDFAKENGDFMNDFFERLKGKRDDEVGEYDLKEGEEEMMVVESFDAVGVNGTGGD